MGRLLAAAFLVAASLAGARAQSLSVGGDARSAPASPNISSVGKMMPPTSGREPAGSSRSSTETEMRRAQRAAEDRDRAWDRKMRRTMGTICDGC